MTDAYAVIGNPIGFTKSPMIHMAFARQTGQQIDYSAILGPLGGFAGRVDAFRKEGGRGINVTAPFKLDAFAYATDSSDSARLAGAANCLKFDGERVHAENFDGIGLTHDITVNLGIPMRGKRVLLLGAGGAARGAMLPFLGQKPSELVLVNRTISKAARLAEAVTAAGNVMVCGYGDLTELPGRHFDLVINATSASLRGEMPPVPPNAFRGASLAYELAYGKGLTPFLKAAQAQGVAQLNDGVGMLVEQAAESFAWWRGVRPDTASLIRQLTVPLT